jgi:hypothetical protein
MGMSETFADFLNEIRPNDESIEIAARAFLSELTDDMVPNDMKSGLIQSALSRDEFDHALQLLTDSPQQRRDACMAFLDWAWQDEGNREGIRAAFKGAQAKLPALEVTLLALIALYGMYLRATGGKKITTHTAKRNADGSFEETIVNEYESPVGVMSLVTKLFGLPKN